MAAFAKGGDFDFAARMLRFIPRITRGKTNVKSPTLTSNGTTLGWRTLEILPGNQDPCSLDGVRWATRPNSSSGTEDFCRCKRKLLGVLASLNHMKVSPDRQCGIQVNPAIPQILSPLDIETFDPVRNLGLSDD